MDGPNTEPKTEPEKKVSVSAITDFRGPFKWLSNFHPVKVTFEYEEYPSVEHAYQAAKTLDEKDRIPLQYVKSPGMAKSMGRSLVLRDDWEDVKVGVMDWLLRQKFAYPDLKQALISTFPHLLIEGNTWGDTFWGVDAKTGHGTNILGQLLMKIRQEYVDAENAKRKAGLEEVKEIPAEPSK